MKMGQTLFVLLIFHIVVKIFLLFEFLKNVLYVVVLEIFFDASLLSVRFFSD